MNSIYFSPKHHDFRAKLRCFLENEIKPNLERWECERCIPRAVWHSLADEGYLGLIYPQKFGGAEKDIFYTAIFLEELGRTSYTGFRVAVAIQAYMATSYLAHSDNNENSHQYLRQAIKGEKVAALAITEPGAGSDLGMLRTTAENSGNSWMINGEKTFVVNGTMADFFVVAVRTHFLRSQAKKGVTGLALLLVDKTTEGVHIEAMDTHGWRGAGIAKVSLHQVKIPQHHVVGKTHQGFVYLMRGMQFERLVAGILAIGGVDACLALTWKYLARREAFDSTLSKMQSIRHTMAELMTEVETLRQLSYHTAWLQSQSKTAILEASMVKLRATELANRAAQQCLHLHGAHGYMAGSAIARISRDAQGATIAAGTNEVMREIIAQHGLEEGNWQALL